MTMRRSIAPFGFLLLLLVHMPAWAVFNINVPAPKSITVDDRMVSVNWTMTTDDNVLPILSLDPGQIESPKGQILSFTNTFSVGPGAFAYAYNDTFVVPATIVEQAIAKGYEFLNYVRYFGQGAEIPLERKVRIDIGGLPDGGSVQPSPVVAVAGGDNVFDVEWRIDIAGAVATLDSRVGRFQRRENGGVLGSVNRRLSTTASGQARVRERLLVPAAVIESAVRQGLRRIFYTRDFRASSRSSRVALIIDIVDAFKRVSGSSGNPRVATGRPGNVPVRWTAEFSPRGGARSLTLRSTGGRFLAPNGTVLGTFSDVITRPGVGNGTLNIAETVTVPTAITIRARRAGISSIFVERTFSDGYTTKTAQVRLALVGAGGAGFHISRVDLHFEDFSRIKVVDGGSDVIAVADLSTRGSGLLEAAWEISTPTGGAPVLFRTVKLVRQYLGGAGRKRIESPPLPVFQPGLHVARLRISRPAPFDEPPMVRYYVASADGDLLADDDELKPIILTGPASGAVLAKDTRFTWRAIEGVVDYRIELFPLGGEPLPPPGVVAEGKTYRRIAAGLLVPGGEGGSALTPLTASYLSSGEAYQWRVVAIGEGGRYIGESNTGVVRVPRQQEETR